jgi:hypothetical protein
MEKITIIKEALKCSLQKKKKKGKRVTAVTA